MRVGSNTRLTKVGLGEQAPVSKRKRRHKRRKLSVRRNSGQEEGRGNVKRHGSRPRASSVSRSSRLGKNASVAAQRVLRAKVPSPLVLMRTFMLPMMIFCALIFQLWIRLAIIERGYELENHRTRAARNVQSLRELELKYAFMTRPDGLGVKAKKRMGFLLTPPRQIRMTGSS